jgi:asparagine synthase (glutamine-hydrolysing)
MCGFSGVLYARKDRIVIPKDLQSMTEVIAHRGPDDEGYHLKDNLGLGFRRLSIIDIDAGNQPMCDSQRRAWIVFNGEIYNYKSIKGDLSKKGYVFNNNSDTEVVINAYLEYGEEFVNRLRGMFSFAIWDDNNKIIILGRDRFGIKPLFYSLNKERLVFGSEMKSILKGGFSKKEFDWQAIDSYFSYGYILSPLSIYKDIRKLSPGHLLIVKNEESQLKGELKRYWKSSFTEDSSINFETYKDLIIEKLNESVKAHLVSDVPVGAFLSGGIDSNAVVSAMVKLYPERVKSFSIGFKEPDFNEALFAKESASKYGTDHTELYLEPYSADIIDKIIDMYDEPFSDSSAIPTYFVSKLASESVKVVLSGDGGDEFFGGYSSYQRLIRMRRYKQLIRICRPLFNKVSLGMPATMKGKRFLYSLTKDPDLVYSYTMQVYEKEKRNFFHPDVIINIMENQAVNIKLGHIAESNTSDYISRMMELDINTYMVDDILTKVDRASMANSLEVRVPIIDHEFFELAARIPSSMKIKGDTGKYIFREALKGQIPDYIYNKPKSGFAIPLTKWFKNDLTKFYLDKLIIARENGIVSPAYIDNLISLKDLGSLTSRVWPIVLFSEWLDLKHNN